MEGCCLLDHSLTRSLRLRLRPRPRPRLRPLSKASLLHLPRDGSTHSELAPLTSINLFTDIATGQSDLGNSSVEVSSFLLTVGCVKLTADAS